MHSAAMQADNKGVDKLCETSPDVMLVLCLPGRLELEVKQEQQMASGAARL